MAVGFFHGVARGRGRAARGATAVAVFGAVHSRALERPYTPPDVAFSFSLLSRGARRGIMATCFRLMYFL